MKVGVIGPIIQDVNIYGNQKIEQAGGVTFYSGCALDSLGVDVTIFGSCGETVPEFPESFKGNIIHLLKQGTTTHTNITPENEPDKRYDQAIVYDNSILPQDISTSDLDDLDHIVLGPMFHSQIGLELVKKLNGTPVSLAPQGMIRYIEGQNTYPQSGEFIRKFNQDVYEILPYVDNVFLDANELVIISGKQQTDKGAAKLLDSGAKTIIVAQGQKGSLIYTNSQKIQVPAFPVEVINPIGAGDSYMAGYIAAEQQHYKDLENRGKFAARCFKISSKFWPIQRYSR
ncbi:hypothetical protein HON49_05375 [archaeon]|nr:hypothetical protein [archaeon]